MTNEEVAAAVNIAAPELTKSVELKDLKSPATEKRSKARSSIKESLKEESQKTYKETQA